MATPPKEDSHPISASPDPQERVLFRAVADGSTDPVTWRKFTERFSKLCYHAIHRVFSRHPHLTLQDVEETFQRFFVHILENDRLLLKRYRGDNGCSEATYLGHLAAYEALEYTRSKDLNIRSREAPAVRIEQRGGGARSASGAASSEFGPDMNAVNAETSLVLSHQQGIVKSAIKRLSPGDLLLYTLHYEEDLSLTEIARILGKTESAIHTQHFRLKERLKKMLAPALDPHPD